MAEKRIDELASVIIEQQRKALTKPLMQRRTISIALLLGLNRPGNHVAVS